MTHDEIRERLATIEEYSRVKWEEHDTRSRRAWAKVDDRQKEIREAFNQVFNEIRDIGNRLSGHSEKICNFQEKISFRVEAAESKIKRWVLGGLLAAGFGLVLAGFGAVMSGAATKLF